MEITKPVIITGTGRCGSTILHHVLARHPEVAWLSQLCHRYPGRPQLNRSAMRSLNIPLVCRSIHRWLNPSEAYRFWNLYCPGFSEPFRDLVETDVTPWRREKVRSVLAQMLVGVRNRLLLKVTGWPRTGFLKNIFPEAKFIHIRRDGRAVAASVLNVDWWHGWRGPHRWRWGTLGSTERAKWEDHGKSFVALAAIEWEILMAAQERAHEKLRSEDLLELRYEDLCADPVGTIGRALEFADLDWSPEYRALFDRFSFRNTNYKWREQLSPEQRQTLQNCLADTLEKYGYA